jgi:hypothetical protein
MRTVAYAPTITAVEAKQPTGYHGRALYLMNVAYGDAMPIHTVSFLTFTLVPEERGQSTY